MALLASACGAAQPSSSRDDRAELVYTQYANGGESSSVWVADADGSNARQLLAKGWSGELSPDGLRLVYLAPGERADEQPRLYVRNVAGGKPQLLGGHEAYARWSPDGTRLAVWDRGRLSLVDPASGKSRMLVESDVRSIGFAPDGRALVYARGDDRPGHEFASDLFVVRLSDGNIEQLTDDGRSDSPVWGRDWIAYRHFWFVNDDHWPSMGEVRFMRPDGSEDHLFARGEVKPSLARYGLEPREFSADGKRLLACNSQEFSCPPVTFTIGDGKRYEPSLEGRTLSGIDLSSDGTEILVVTGAAEGPYDLYAIPFTGGQARLLAKNAENANWSDGD